MVSDSEFQLKRRAAHLMHDQLDINPHSTCTELAEIAAIFLHHDEWLDDSDHWIWDLALKIGDQT